MRYKIFWPIIALTFLPLLTGLYLMGFGRFWYIFLIVSVSCVGLILLFLQRLVLEPAEKVETVLQQIVQGEFPSISNLSQPWTTIIQRLKSIVVFLQINEQGAEDKVSLLEEQNRELREKELSLRRAYQTLKNANSIQNELRGLMDVDKLLEESVELCVSNISANKGFFLKFDLNDPDKAQIVSPFGIQLDSGTIVPIRSFRHILRKLDLDAPDVIPVSASNHRNEICSVPFQFALIAPVVVDREIWGTFCLMDKEKRGGGMVDFSEPDRQLLGNIAGNLSKDWKSAHLFELATIDSLSQLFVRRYFEKRLDEELLRANRYWEIFSILMIDIDHFKRFNDNYGHQTGDQVIRQVAKTIKYSVRQEIDQVGRYGGEEMIVLLPQTAQDAAQTVAERIRREIANLQLPTLPDAQITVSIGVSIYQPGKAIQEQLVGSSHKKERDHLVIKERTQLIQLADEALYQAKETGRNRVCMANFQVEQIT